MYERATAIVRGMMYMHQCTHNSYPRSHHVEADAQATLKALCLLHNAPAQLQGREWLIPKGSS